MEDFDESLFGCCQHILSCCFAFLVPCGVFCLQGAAIETASERRVRCTGRCCIGMILGPIGGALNRMKLRDILDIRGSGLYDLFVWCFCAPCAATQEYRESQLQKPAV